MVAPKTDAPARTVTVKIVRQDGPNAPRVTLPGGAGF